MNTALILQAAVKDSCTGDDIVMIHDGGRPLISRKCYKVIRARSGKDGKRNIYGCKKYRIERTI